MFFRTEAAVDLDAAEHNFSVTRQKLPQGVRLMCVIKADAYGHGAVELARLFEGRADFYGVACIEEAMELKRAGIKTPVMILGAVNEACFEEAVQNDIRIPVFEEEQVERLSECAVRLGKKAPFHFCVDTGMSRIGFQPTEESADMCLRIAALPGLFAEGLFSHFATADEKELSKALHQRQLFSDFIEMLERRGLHIPIKHINNSAGIMNFDKYFDMCRMGIILYGLYPSHEVKKELLDIRPVMQWRTHISYIKELEPGREISYGGIYTTKAPRRIATVPVGYADGYPRCLSNSGRVLINGSFAPITGRVCMDQFMVDVTGIDCREGDEVVLVGKSGGRELTMEEVSESAHSFNYELPCRISRRVTRAYYRSGALVSYKNYVY